MLRTHWEARYLVELSVDCSVNRLETDQGRILLQCLEQSQVQMLGELALAEECSGEKFVTMYKRRLRRVNM